MYAFAVLGEDAEATLERLLPELDGRVGTVRLEEARSDGSATVARGDTEYVLGDGWRAAGEGMALDDALDRLTPDHAYAAVVGGDDHGLPRIAVGGTVDDDASEVLAAADSPRDLDVDAVIDAIRKTEPHETLESLVAALKRSPSAEYAGAIATFTGRVRPKEDEDDERTRYLEFEKYEGVAEDRMRRIERELAERDGVLEVRLHHRTGRIEDGEDIVFVVVLAGHRREAFEAVEDGIDRLKDEVPLFKKEVTASDTFWVHEREA
jgi:molybdopterin synthase catalytic subunit